MRGERAAATRGRIRASVVSAWASAARALHPLLRRRERAEAATGFGQPVQRCDPLVDRQQIETALGRGDARRALAPALESRPEREREFGAIHAACRAAAGDVLQLGARFEGRTLGRERRARFGGLQFGGEPAGIGVRGERAARRFAEVERLDGRHGRREQHREQRERACPGQRSHGISSEPGSGRAGVVRTGARWHPNPGQRRSWVLGGSIGTGIARSASTKCGAIRAIERWTASMPDRVATAPGWPQVWLQTSQWLCGPCPESCESRRESRCSSTLVAPSDEPCACPTASRLPASRLTTSSRMIPARTGLSID